MKSSTISSGLGLWPYGHGAMIPAFYLALISSNPFSRTDNSLPPLVRRRRRRRRREGRKEYEGRKEEYSFVIDSKHKNNNTNNHITYLNIAIF